ncbi:hypothetical protein D3C76_117510 [compost metagenome]
MFWMRKYNGLLSINQLALLFRQASQLRCGIAGRLEHCEHRVVDNSSAGTVVQFNFEPVLLQPTVCFLSQLLKWNILQFWITPDKHGR